MPAFPDISFPIEVVGSEQYQFALKDICDGKTHVVVPARCVPYDDWVRVEIRGATVGRLTWQAEWTYQRTGDGARECLATVDAGVDGKQLAVRLDLALPIVTPEIAIHEGRYYECEIVGDSKCQPALRAIFRKRAGQEPAAWAPLVTAQLVLEDTELPGVRVEIEGQPVGSLGKVNARKYGVLANAPKTAPAFITEMESWDGRKRYSVRLSLVLQYLAQAMRSLVNRMGVEPPPKASVSIVSRGELA